MAVDQETTSVGSVREARRIVTFDWPDVLEEPAAADPAPAGVSVANGGGSSSTSDHVTVLFAAFIGLNISWEIGGYPLALAYLCALAALVFAERHRVSRCGGEAQSHQTGGVT